MFYFSLKEYDELNAIENESEFQFGGFHFILNKNAIEILYRFYWHVSSYHIRISAASNSFAYMTDRISWYKSFNHHDTYLQALTILTNDKHNKTRLIFLSQLQFKSYQLRARVCVWKVWKSMIQTTLCSHLAFWLSPFSAYWIHSLSSKLEIHGINSSQTIRMIRCYIATAVFEAALLNLPANSFVIE